MGYERQLASARRMLAAKGQACIWRKPADLDEDADAWRDIREGDPTDTPVSIAWFAPRDLGRGGEVFLAAMAGQTLDVPEGFEIGIMAASDFEPLPSDTIVRGEGEEVSITSIDRLAPDGTAILYFVKVKL